MVLKRGFTSTVLLLLVFVLAGCASLFPGVETPPVDAPRGALDIQLDLTELSNVNQMPDDAFLTLTRETTTVNERFVLVDDKSELSLRGLEPGSWDGTLRLVVGAADDTLATLRGRVEIVEDKTTTFSVRATWDGTNARLILEDEDSTPGTDPGDGNGDGDDDDKEPVVTRDVRYIQSGNRRETRTEVYVIRSSVPGPTVMVVGGVHGGETSGWMVAGEVAKTWDIDRGTLVVLPEANKDAVNRRVRTGRDGRDMNRAFPFGRSINRPTDWLMAREIWNVVEEFQPEALIDLHEGWGLREANDRFPGGTLSVGQTIIAYPARDARQFANHVINVLNRDHNPFYQNVSRWTYEFRLIGPPVQGSLAYKAGYDLGIPTFIAEPTQGRTDRHSTTVEQRRRWHRVIVEEFLRWYGVLDS